RRRRGAWRPRRRRRPEGRRQSKRRSSRHIYPGGIIGQYRPGKKEMVMDRQGRKAAVAAYKERRPAHGVYGVICTLTGEAWVGCSRHVDTQQNGVWFTLRLGTSPHASLP